MAVASVASPIFSCCAPAADPQQAKSAMSTMDLRRFISLLSRSIEQSWRRCISYFAAEIIILRERLAAA
jgi:hypothetical protein